MDPDQIRNYCASSPFGMEELVKADQDLKRKRGVDFYHTVTVTAMKEYFCDLCGTPIDKKEDHHKQSGIQEGDFYTLRYHRICGDLTSFAYRNLPGYEEGCSPYPGDFHFLIRSWLLRTELEVHEANTAGLAAQDYYEDKRFKK